MRLGYKGLRDTNAPDYFVTSSMTNKKEIKNNLETLAVAAKVRKPFLTKS
jgi:hypothetical protein